MNGKIIWPGNPIETAPKDGGVFLGYDPAHPYQNWLICWWDAREWRDHETGISHVGHWASIDHQTGEDGFCDPVCWWELPSEDVAARS
ncbi:hypothetical protein [Rhizobium sp. BK602]|uniref:hypothetical protein n=1 Tax=Rhizobium sp. BK602 TaxID=2586986 RepID=UPI00161248AD|nr:hypothetical protein [Rhizobium sp. BK602]MBB3608677.1 hypothetical protein [Rhizobium sp. BK602]